MRRRKHYIIILLTLVFAFPLIFQSVHIIGHKKHFVIESESCCVQHSNQKFAAEIKVTSEHCPICEYEFAIFSVSEFSNIYPSTFFIDFQYNTLSEVFHLYFRGSNRSLRAPPFQS
jgi:hypothetical protein